MHTFVQAWKRQAIWALIFSLAVSVVFSSQAASAATGKDLKKQAYTALQKVVKFYQKSDNDYVFNENFDWEMIGLAHAGEKLDASKWKDANDKTVIDFWATRIKTEKEPGQLAKIAIALMKNGYDPTNFGGRNLLREIAKAEQENGRMGDDQYTIFNHALSIVALEMYDYSYDRDKATEFLLKSINRADLYPDDWAFSLHALSFLEDIDGVEEAQKEIIQKLEAAQNNEGAINESPDSTLETLAALPAVGVDVLETPWSKSVSYALSNQLDDGSFQSAYSNGDTSLFTTEKGLYALAVIKKGSALYTRLTDREKANLKVHQSTDIDLPEDVQVYDGLANLQKDHQVTPGKTGFAISSKQLFVRTNVEELAQKEKPLAILVKALKGKTVAATAIVQSNSAEAQSMTAGLSLSRGSYRVEINYWYGLDDEAETAKDSVSFAVVVK